MGEWKGLAARILIKELLKKPPDRFAIYGRDHKHVIKMERRETNFVPSASQLFVLNLETGERRRALFQDVVNLAKLISYPP